MLSRLEMASVKRAAKDVSILRRKLAKQTAIKAAANKEIEEIENQISLWEAPIIKMTGGFTSEEVLDGTMDKTIAAKSEEAEEVQAPSESAKSEQPFSDIQDLETNDEGHTEDLATDPVSSKISDTEL